MPRRDDPAATGRTQRPRRTDGLPRHAKLMRAWRSAHGTTLRYPLLAGRAALGDCSPPTRQPVPRGCRAARPAPHPRPDVAPPATGDHARRWRRETTQWVLSGPAADRIGTRARIEGAEREPVSPLRRCLLWVCCALMLLAGAPAIPPAGCAADGYDDAGESSGCCAAQCCCERPVEHADTCPCRDTRHPAPVPPTSGPRLDAAVPPEPHHQPRHEHAPRAPPVAVVHAGLPIGLLPRISRQKALSVWRC